MKQEISNKNPRDIKHLVVHCTATAPTVNLKAIRNYWKNVKGWGDTPGYHYIILRNGEVINLLEESKISYGAFGHNQNSIHVAYIGGINEKNIPADNRTAEQKEAMFDLLLSLMEKYPSSEPIGHRDFPGVKKACPCFDVKKWFYSHTPNIISNH